MAPHVLPGFETVKTDDLLTNKRQYCFISATMRTFHALPLLLAAAPIEAAFSWTSVHTGGGGGFIPSIVFHPKTKGVAYARADIGGMYKLNSDDSWTPISDGIAQDASWYEHLSDWQEDFVINDT
jgi:hypothetical protein